VSVIRTQEELIQAVDNLPLVRNPLEELRRRGHDIDSSLAREIAPSRPLSEEEEAAFEELSREVDRIRLRVVEPRQVPRSLPAGEYDLMLALGLEPIADLLSALYLSGALPHQFGHERASDLFKLGELRQAFSGVPVAPDIAVGTLRFTAVPALAAREGVNALILSQAFELLIDRLEPGPVMSQGGVRRRRAVTALRATLTLAVVATARYESPESIRLALSGVDLSALRPSVSVHPDSPLQPSSTDNLEEFETAIAGRLVFAAEWLGLQELPLAPEIKLPIGDLSVTVSRADIRTAITNGRAALLVGIVLSGSEGPDPQAGDPERLSRNPITLDVANLYVSAHEELFRKVLRKGLDSGELQRRATEFRGDARVEGARVDLRPGELRLDIDMRLVDFCSFNADLTFTANLTFRFSLFQGRVNVTHELGIDLHTWSTVKCALAEFAALGVLSFVALGGFALPLRIAHFAALAGGASSNGGISFGAIFDSMRPIPRTELLPRIEAIQHVIDDLKLELIGRLTLQLDDLNSYFYLRLVRRGGLLGHERIPVTDAAVKIVDQDVPQPAGDDVVLQDERTTRRETDRTRTTVTTVDELTGGDQVLGAVVSDRTGCATFILPPYSLVTSGGTRTTTTVEARRVGSGWESSADETIELIPERRPDVYFLIELSSGETFDTRALAPGLLVNWAERRFGRIDSPVTFVLV
jgi:hypothetical protein